MKLDLGLRILVFHKNGAYIRDLVIRLIKMKKNANDQKCMPTLTFCIFGTRYVSKPLEQSLIV